MQLIVAQLQQISVSPQMISRFIERKIPREPTSVKTASACSVWTTSRYTNVEAAYRCPQTSVSLRFGSVKPDLALTEFFSSFHQVCIGTKTRRIDFGLGFFQPLLAFPHTFTRQTRYNRGAQIIGPHLRDIGIKMRTGLLHHLAH